METDVVYDVLGFRFELQGNDPELLRALSTVLEGSRTVAGTNHCLSFVTTDQVAEVFLDDRPCGEPKRTELIRYLLWFIAEQVLERDRPSALIHAAGIVSNDAMIVVAGSSGAGKSTLTAAMVAEGAHLLSDELVEIGAAGCVVNGFQRDVMLVDGSWDLLTQCGLASLLDSVDLPHVGGKAARGAAARATGPFPTQTIAVVLEDRGATFRVDSLRSAEIAVALLSHAFEPRRLVRAKLSVVRSLAIEATGFRCSGGTLEERVRWLQSVTIPLA